MVSQNIQIKIYGTAGCETWSVVLSEEHRLRVLENRVLRVLESRVLRVLENRVLRVLENRVLRVLENRVMRVLENRVLRVLENRVLRVLENRVLRLLENRVLRLLENRVLRQTFGNKREEVTRGGIKLNVEGRQIVRGVMGGACSVHMREGNCNRHLCGRV